MLLPVFDFPFKKECGARFMKRMRKPQRDSRERSLETPEHGEKSGSEQDSRRGHWGLDPGPEDVA